LGGEYDEHNAQATIKEKLTAEDPFFKKTIKTKKKKVDMKMCRDVN